MRVLIIALFLFFMNSAIAITKCELQGKVTYKKGNCPKNATSKYLLKDKYVEESQLQEYYQERITQSEKDFVRMTTPEKSADQSDSWLDIETQQSKLQSLELEKVEGKSSNDNVRKTNDAEANLQLFEMRQKLEQYNQELQRLQKQ